MHRDLRPFKRILKRVTADGGVTLFYGNNQPAIVEQQRNLQIVVAADKREFRRDRSFLRSIYRGGYRDIVVFSKVCLMDVMFVVIHRHPRSDGDGLIC